MKVSVSNMDVVKVSQKAKLNQMAALIQECRNSGMSVRDWCKENNFSEPSYYYWLKKIRTHIIETSEVNQVSVISETSPFVPVELNSQPPKVDESKIIIIKGDIHIELPDTINEELLINIARSLLC